MQTAPAHPFLGSAVRFAAPETARELIGAADSFTRRLSGPERQARVGTTEAIDLPAYLRFCTGHVRPWTPPEIDRLTQILRDTAARAEALGLRLPLPPEIHLVKTTGREEGGAGGYTREAAIIFREDAASPGLFAHELFHVMTRHHPGLASRAYALLGFYEIPEIPDDDPARITNPDTLGIRHAIEVRHGGEARAVCPVLRGKWPYRGGDFFSYVEKKLMVLARTDGRSTPASEPGRPSYLGYDEVEGLYEKIGRNTSYNFHPEEISAMHFEFLVTGRDDLPDPRLVDGLRGLFAGAPA